MEEQNNPANQNTETNQGAPSQKKLIIIIIIVLVGLYLVQSYMYSPGRMAERILEKASNGEYNVSVDRDGAYNVTGKDGESVSVTSGGATKVPDNWPSSVPIPKGVNIEYAAVMSGKDSEAVSTLTYTTSDSMQSVSDLYKNELAANGWSIEGQISTGDGFVLSATRNEKEVTSVYITNSSGKTSVTLSVQTIN
ncbi:MAG: hypothetical protein WAW13_04075 [Minisyncoccia bacterium]